MDRPDRLPAFQLRIWSNADGSSSVIADDTPPRTDPIATPANVRRMGVAPPRPTEPSAYTTTVATTAPRNANQMYDQMLVRPNTATAITTANPAPALTPRIPGSASGLRVMAWISAPAIPSAAPTSRPSTVRGTRSSRTIT